MDLECSTVGDIYMDKQNTAPHSNFTVHGDIGFFAAAAAVVLKTLCKKQHKGERVDFCLHFQSGGSPSLWEGHDIRLLRLPTSHVTTRKGVGLLL